MARDADAADEGSVEERAARDLAENGRQQYAWREVDGERRLVVVGISFTVVAQPAEDFEAFKERMLRFAARLAALRHPVTGLTFHRRAAQGKRPWCEFECSTLDQ